MLVHSLSLKLELKLSCSSLQVQPEKVKLMQRLSQSRPLYEAFKQIKEGELWSSLTEAQKRIVDGELRDFVLGGVALEVCRGSAAGKHWRRHCDL